MRLSVIDIKKQEFKKSFKGYDVSEVEAYLDTVANEMEKMVRENELLKEKISELENQLNEANKEIQVFKDNEKTFQKAIVKSQDLSEEVLENANKRAELIIKEAEILASKTKIQTQQDMIALQQQLEELRLNNENIIEDVRNFLIDKLNMIDEYNKHRKILKLDPSAGNLKDIKNEKGLDENKSFDLSLDDKPAY
jgi:cell division initiation protein